MTEPTGREHGKNFEDVFKKLCLLRNCLVEKNDLTAVFNFKNKVSVKKSQLDFLVVYDGRVGLFDCKSFAKGHFVHSDINKSQVARAARYNNARVPAGFVCYFRDRGIVSYFSGCMLENRQGTRFVPESGLSLGRWDNVDIRPVFRADPRFP